MFSNSLGSTKTDNKSNPHQFPQVHNLGLISKIHNDYDSHNFDESKGVIQIWREKNPYLKD